MADTSASVPRLWPASHRDLSEARPPGLSFHVYAVWGDRVILMGQPALEGGCSGWEEVWSRGGSGGSHVRLVPAELRVQASPEVLQGLRRAQGLGLGRKAGGREATPTAPLTERAAQRPWG